MIKTISLSLIIIFNLLHLTTSTISFLTTQNALYEHDVYNVLPWTKDWNYTTKIPVVNLQLSIN